MNEPPGMGWDGMGWDGMGWGRESTYIHTYIHTLRVDCGREVESCADSNGGSRSTRTRMVELVSFERKKKL